MGEQIISILGDNLGQQADHVVESVVNPTREDILKDRANRVFGMRIRKDEMRDLYDRTGRRVEHPSPIAYDDLVKGSVVVLKLGDLSRDRDTNPNFYIPDVAVLEQGGLICVACRGAVNIDFANVSTAGSTVDPNAYHFIDIRSVGHYEDYNAQSVVVHIGRAPTQDFRFPDSSIQLRDGVVGREHRTISRQHVDVDISRFGSGPKLLQVGFWNGNYGERDARMPLTKFCVISERSIPR